MFANEMEMFFSLLSRQYVISLLTVKCFKCINTRMDIYIYIYIYIYICIYIFMTEHYTSV